MAKKNKTKRMGYTWYPKDWASSERVARLNLAERGLYRELIDLAYLTDNRINFDLKFLMRRTSSSPKAFNRAFDKLQNVRNLDNEPLIEIVNGVITVNACTDRLYLIKTLASNGSNGGRPPQGEGQKPGENDNQDVPPLVPNNETKGESQRESKSESKSETIPKGIVSGAEAPPPSKKSNPKRKFEGTVEERSELFRKELIPFAGTGEGQYPRKMVRRFYDYWQEPNHEKTLMKFEMQKTWSTPHRLKNWSDREKDFGDKPSTQSEGEGFDMSQFNL